MKTFAIALLALAPLACAYSTPGESVYDIHPAYDGGGGGSTGSDNTDPNSSVDDAGTTCHVQGSASVSGVTLDAKDAIEIFDATKAEFTFRIADYGGACALGDKHRAGSNVVSIVYSGNALKSGTYDVATTAGLSAKYEQYGAACAVTSSATAASGSITFDRLDECGGKGSFDLQFGSSHVTGSFTASVCAIAGGGGGCE